MDDGYVVAVSDGLDIGSFVGLEVVWSIRRFTAFYIIAFSRGILCGTSHGMSWASHADAVGCREVCHGMSHADAVGCHERFVGGCPAG